jgi:hypothetical protein
MSIESSRISYRNYHENKGISIAGIGIILIVTLFSFSNKVSIRFGPCFENTGCPVILGRVINNWGLWTIMMIVTGLKEASMAYGLTTYRTWYYNEVMDHKATIPDKSTQKIMLMVTIWKTFGYASGIFDIVVVISGELQFIFVQLISEVLISCINTYIAILEKRRTISSDEIPMLEV